MHHHSSDFPALLFVEAYMFMETHTCTYRASVIKSAIALALANIQAEDGEPPPICRQVVLDFLCDNDNSSNDSDDALYMSTIFKAASIMLVNLHLSGARERQTAGIR
jgi:hypothetical protein